MPPLLLSTEILGRRATVPQPRTFSQVRRMMAGARGSRTHRANRRVAANGFEDREDHQAPSAPETTQQAWQ